MMVIEYANKKADTQDILKPLALAFLVQIERQYAAEYPAPEPSGISEQVLQYMSSHSDVATLKCIASHFPTIQTTYRHFSGVRRESRFPSFFWLREWKRPPSCFRRPACPWKKSPPCLAMGTAAISTRPSGNTTAVPRANTYSLKGHSRRLCLCLSPVQKKQGRRQYERSKPKNERELWPGRV